MRESRGAGCSSEATDAFLFGLEARRFGCGRETRRTRQGIARAGEGGAPQLKTRQVGEVEVACTLASRLRGLLGRGRYSGVLLLSPCNDVHTFGMRYDIDIAFVDSDGRVVESHCGVGAWRRLRCAEACATLERISTSATWFERGDRVELKRLVQEAMETGREKRS